MDEMWDDTDTVMFNGVPFTTETTYTASGLEAGTTVYVRVAAAAGTVAQPLVSNFSTHVTGMTTAASGSLAPANLRVKERGSDFIEWEWDAVAGADGYQSQFSTNSGFSSPSDAFHQGMNMTSRRVSNLDAESDGYLRVRTYTGTLSEPTYGMWTAGHMATTAELPPAVPLNAPTDLEVTRRADDSITLEWDSVRNAGSYEVQQQEPGDDDWDFASCGGGDHVVEDEECVASDLTAGTEYDFRVRAVPSDTDRYGTSVWSDTAESSTTGDAPRTQTDPTPGGMGALNIQWESDHDSIDFVWDRVAGSTYQYSILDVSEMDSANPCRDAEWTDVSFASLTYVEDTETDASDDIQPGSVKGLCVRTSDGGSVSYAWGIVAPEEPGLATPVGGTAIVNKSKTTAIEWGGVSLVEGFDYDIKVAADPERSSTIDATATALDREVQDACRDGKEVERGTADITYTQTNVVDGSKLTEYTGYLLCLRYRNDAGASVWSVPVANDTAAAHNTDEAVLKSFTRPAKPPRPTIVNSLTRTTEPTASTNGSVQPVWSSGVRNVTNVPRQSEGFTASSWISVAGGGKALKSTDCVASGETAPDGYAELALDATTPIKDTGQGIQIETNAASPRLGFDQKVYLCLRAMNASGVDEGGAGPWEISSVYTIYDPAGLTASATHERTANDTDPVTYDVTYTVTIKEWNTDWGYTVQEGTNDAGACSTVSGDDEAEITWAGLALSAKRTVRVYADGSCTDGTLIKTLSYTNPSR